MQKLSYKLLIFFISISFLNSQTSNCQILTSSTLEADKLFEQREYSKALEKYQELLSQGKYTSQMLMKMAYIQEGFENIPQAMYYLSLLNKLAPNESTLQKMESVAEKYSLEGYNVSDEAYFIFLIRKYKSEAVITLSLIGILGFALLFWLQQRRYSLGFPSVLLGLYCLVIFWMVNLQQNTSKAIVIEGGAFIMDAPSAGANLISTLKAGHRLPIIGQNDIWYEIEWQGKTAFIRNSNVQMID